LGHFDDDATYLHLLNRCTFLFCDDLAIACVNSFSANSSVRLPILIPIAAASSAAAFGNCEQ
jgi:hypothetical protein